MTRRPPDANPPAVDGGKDDHIMPAHANREVAIVTLIPANEDIGEIKRFTGDVRP